MNMSTSSAVLEASDAAAQERQKIVEPENANMVCSPQTESVTNDSELIRILDTLLDSDTTITFRTVAREHPRIKHASSFTRDPARAKLILEYQAQQNERRAWVARARKQSISTMTARLAQRDELITKLKLKIEALTASHKAMLMAVGELGGTSKWLRFFEAHRNFRELLLEMNLMPTANVTQLAPKDGRKSDATGSRGGEPNTCA